ncbi:MAG: hypothetical protein ACRC80_14530 [Waterburya sp.]
MTCTYTLDTNDYLARLQHKRFQQSYTPIPYSLFPEGSIDKLYSALDIKPEDAPEPFTVGAHNDGSFRTLYTPTIMASDGVTVVKMGSVLVPLSDNITVSFSGKDTIVASLSCNKKTVVLPILFKEDATAKAEELNDDPDSIVKYLAEAKVGGAGKFRFSVKVSELPLGTYNIVGYTIYNGVSYDTLYLRCVEECDLLDIEAYNSETKVNETVNIPAGEVFSIRGNSKLLTFFRAKPVVTETDPAKLTVVKHGTVMGKPSAEVKITLSALEDF